MKKLFKCFFIILVITFISPFLLSPRATTAQENNDYKVLAPLPGIAEKPGDTTDINKYIPGMFNFAIGLAAIFVVVMIVYGGVQYLTTDAFSGKKEGKDRIFNAIKALVLVLGAYLILYEINPKLVDIDLTIESVKAPPLSTVAVGKPMTADQIAESNQIRAQLQENGVITYKGPCAEGQTTLCVNLNDLPESAFNGVIDLKKLCGTNCDITITGGTEGGHKTHGPDKPMLDLRPNTELNSYITSKDKNPVQTNDGLLYKISINGNETRFLRESNPDHWHVVFTNTPLEQ